MLFTPGRLTRAAADCASKVRVLDLAFLPLELVLRRQLEIIPNVPSTALSPPATRYIMLFVGSSPLLLSRQHLLE